MNVITIESQLANIFILNNYFLSLSRLLLSFCKCITIIINSYSIYYLRIINNINDCIIDIFLNYYIININYVLNKIYECRLKFINNNIE